MFSEDLGKTGRGWKVHPGQTEWKAHDCSEQKETEKEKHSTLSSFYSTPIFTFCPSLLPEAERDSLEQWLRGQPSNCLSWKNTISQQKLWRKECYILTLSSLPDGEWKAQTYAFPHTLRCTGLRLTSKEGFGKFSKWQHAPPSIFNYKANRRLSKRGPERDSHLSTLFITGANSCRVLIPEKGPSTSWDPSTGRLSAEAACASRRGRGLRLTR